MTKILGLQGLTVTKSDETQALANSTDSNHCNSSTSVQC